MYLERYSGKVVAENTLFLPHCLSSELHQVILTMLILLLA
jgi:hypothetical protein